ncbi:zinc-binding dehydrogenase [Actinoallomurus purpureus]|uniref:zinc-binding dehydrogenase n=1 Tax=Actinoallomurus purpureus TaxID=478114 RepID=UPI0020938939|nr:zinc-binding dehydrogenase [Actinoallomurus purpureus]MCO6006420.1 zinc-binding dehydrogenase [Actinoallomurus purpureus]
MRVIEVRRFGGPEELVPVDRPDPEPGPGQVVVAVSAVDTLFVETQIRSGRGGEWFGVRPPYVPGDGVAGEVSAVGEGVDAAWTGRRVATRTPDGGYASHVVVPADGLLPVPYGLDLTDAAALLHDGVTGLGVFEAARVRSGEWVLVVAAAGGMGSLLVQLSKAAGAQVVAAARGKRKLDLARELGADVVVDYSEPEWTDRVREGADGRGPDVVFDGAGGEIGRVAVAVAADGARISAHGASSGGFAPIDTDEAARRGLTVRGIQDLQFGPEEYRRLAERAFDEAAAGRLRPVIGRTFPLERAADAHAAIEAREVLGKALLVC